MNEASAAVKTLLVQLEDLAGQLETPGLAFRREMLRQELAEAEYQEMQLFDEALEQWRRRMGRAG